MNVEYVSKDGGRGRYFDVEHYQQDQDGIGFFNDDGLGFVQPDTLVTYAGPGHTGGVPVGDERSLADVMDELREKEATTDGRFVVASSSYSPIPFEE